MRPMFAACEYVLCVEYFDCCSDSHANTIMCMTLHVTDVTSESGPAHARALLAHPLVGTGQRLHAGPGRLHRAY